MRPIPALCAAVTAATLALAAADARAVMCYVLFDRTENVVYRDVFPPIDLSDAGKAEREAMRQRGEFLMFMDAEHCPRLEFLTGYAGNVAVRLDDTLSPTRLPARQAATPAAPRATRAPR